jgi:hypothetical protein
MIHESYPWKDDLLENANEIERACANHTGSEDRYLILEKMVFISAFIMRKLLDSNKLSSIFETVTVTCTEHIFKSEKVDNKREYQDFVSDELYDFDNPTEEQVKLRKILGIIIHSNIFSIAAGEDEAIEGFFVNSEVSRQEGLWLIGFPPFISLMRRVGEDYPAVSRAVYDIDKNEWYRWRGSDPEPTHVKKNIARIQDKWSR